MEQSLALTLVLSVILFVFTLFFSYVSKFVSGKYISNNIKCLAGGIILGTMIFHILPDIYEVKESYVAPLFAGLSFLILFSIDKLYLYSTDASEQDSLPSNITKIQAIIFVTALSVHSFLEGLGICSKSGKQLHWYLVGLLGHKWVEAFVLGVSIFSSTFSNNIILTLIIFYSSLTSVGIIAGYIILKLVSDQTITILVTQILTGLSSGSFFYIGFIEMLGNVFEEKTFQYKKNKQKLAYLTTGFLLMSSVCIGAGYIETLSNQE